MYLHSKKNQKIKASTQNLNVNLIIRVISFLSLIPVAILAATDLAAYFHRSENALFVRDPYFLLSLSLALYSVYPLSRIMRGGVYEKYKLSEILLYVLIAKPVLFSGLFDSYVLRDLIFMGYLINLITSLMPLALSLAVFSFDLVLGVVLLHGRDPGSFFEPLFFIHTVAAMMASVIVKILIDNLRRTRTLHDRSRHAVTEFVKVNMRTQDNVDRSSYSAMHKERERISREVHDTVGYTLTALLLQIQANQEVVRAGESHAVLLDRLEKQEKMIRSAITDVREEIRNLRSEESFHRNGRDRWKRLCQVFSESTCIRIIANISENLDVVSDLISDNIYRIIQESLTNSYRHGNADYIDVSMTWDEPEETVYLRISDNGVGCSYYEMGTGMRSMRERIEQMKGEVYWQSQVNKGFDIGITIPWGGVRHE